MMNILFVLPIVAYVVANPFEEVLTSLHSIVRERQIIEEIINSRNRVVQSSSYSLEELEAHILTIVERGDFTDNKDLESLCNMIPVADVARVFDLMEATGISRWESSVAVVRETALAEINTIARDLEDLPAYFWNVVVANFEIIADFIDEFQEEFGIVDVAHVPIPENDPNLKMCLEILRPLVFRQDPVTIHATKRQLAEFLASISIGNTVKYTLIRLATIRALDQVFVERELARRLQDNTYVVGLISSSYEKLFQSLRFRLNKRAGSL